MEVRFNCPNCNQELEVDVTEPETTIECPTCNSSIVVPAVEEEASVEAEPPAAAAAPPPPPAGHAPPPHPEAHPHGQGQEPIDSIHREAHVVNAMASSAAAKIERHFSVPVHNKPTEILVQKVVKEEDVPATPDAKKRIKLKIFRHTDCVEVGHDRYEEIVSQFLNKVGEENVINLSNLTYTHVDIGSQKILTDYAFQILYRG